MQVGRANGADEEYSGVETMRLLDGTNAVESLHAALSALSTLGVPVRWSQWFPFGEFFCGKGGEAGESINFSG